MLEPGAQPEICRPMDQIFLDSVIRENLEGEPVSSAIAEFLEYSKSVKRGVHSPRTKVVDHLKRLSDLESKIKAVWNLKTEQCLDDYERRQALACVILRGCQIFIKICIDIMVSTVIELELHLQYWSDFSNSPRSFLHRCLIFNYIEPKYIGKKTPLFQMAYANLTWLRTIHNKLINETGSFLRWYWRLKCVEDFPNHNEGSHFVAFLKEAFVLVSSNDPDQPRPFDLPICLNIPYLFDLFLQTVSKSRGFFKEINRSVEESRRPHHLSRYFILYATGFMGTFTFSLLGVGCSSMINRTLRYCWNSGAKLMEEHFSRPVRALFNTIFFTSKRSRTDKSVLHNERAHLEDLIVQYPSEGGISVEQQTKPDMTLVMDTYTKDVNQLSKYNVNSIPRLLEGLQVQLQAAKVQIYEIRGQVDQIIDANKISIYLLSLIPTSMLAYIAFSAIKRVYQGPRLDIVTFKYRFRRHILKLHSLILGFQDQSKESDKTVGNMLQTCERLRILIHNAVQSSACDHNPNDKKLLEEDLHLFLDFEYDVNQRFRQLARMERFYL